ncbi:hypothetical protein EMIHUDRAFT_249435 [Emiliania huxleyi CCMP1516]|uniref:PhoD-like phosphatase metallophosphatase domain-containing protein n=2 Tax=Emiliania huxleyi TaxID=2903 RepID=A0A0D3I8N4_EMIH1|nr:hypothetical protein EMIHUDRAFT_218706 [Emiliania huxleyi CCMP1516]XP_005760048.1 hypothetical protein EMIHUDRAFT_249435 [Emiliania huxleyi CCMP1516]EOD06972.1 hypothetical protein EMIHUDRAFT_218706 [Emiliania huxleyi CCMP1516]EOD07619.1 hypothetical protein EMIHUDRAFT_249435 [Emiliania huxleyi CCMP1516]|eukprot:XP_005759401.1 hypothetical protein EMIHUDRAFT_218706 [Emiliania huxleyi CCMP1516]
MTAARVGTVVVDGEVVPHNLELQQPDLRAAAGAPAAREVFVRKACPAGRPAAAITCSFGIVAAALAYTLFYLIAAPPPLPVAAPLPSADRVLTRVVHGSCSKQTLPQPFWRTVGSLAPDLFVYNGDIVYGDCADVARPHEAWSEPACEELRTAWADLFAHEEFTSARAVTPVIGMPDDHDYGLNDCGASNPYKQTAKDLFLERFGAAEDDPRRSRGGLYTSHAFGAAPNRTQVILLDTRWFRSELKRDSGAAHGRYAPYTEAEAEAGRLTMLGEEQWAWLEARLREPADLRLVFSTVQVLSTAHGWERWGLIPTEVRRLRRLIRSSAARGVVFLSGDRHVGGVYVQPAAAGLNPYPLYEATASSLTHTVPPSLATGDEPPHEPDADLSSSARRLGALLHLNHVGSVDVDWEARAVTLRLITDDTCAAPAWEGCQQGGSTAGATERSVTLRLDVDLAPPPECGRPCATPLNPAATCAAFEGLFSCAGSSELLGCNCTGCCAGEGEL